MLTESFMAECICSELLLKAYEDMNGKIREKYGWWVKKMLFPGGELPLEAMEEIFGSIGQEEVRYNRYYVLTPKKSVAYRAVLTRNEGEACAGICVLLPPVRTVPTDGWRKKSIAAGKRFGRIYRVWLCLMGISGFFTEMQQHRKKGGKKMNKGLLHLYTGEGKGKTTAAMGLALRAAGAGEKGANPAVYEGTGYRGAAQPFPHT